MNLTALPALAEHRVESHECSLAAIVFHARQPSVRAKIDALEPSLAAILVNRGARIGPLNTVRQMRAAPGATDALAAPP